MRRNLKLTGIKSGFRWRYTFYTEHCLCWCCAAANKLPSDCAPRMFTKGDNLVVVLPPTARLPPLSSYQVQIDCVVGASFSSPVLVIMREQDPGENALKWLPSSWPKQHPDARPRRSTLHRLRRNSTACIRKYYDPCLNIDLEIKFPPYFVLLAGVLLW